MDEGTIDDLSQPSTVQSVFVGLMLGKIAEGFLCYTQKTLKGSGFTWTNNKMSEVSGAVQKASW